MAESLRILVVEDHRDTREVVSSYLEMIGCVVASVATVADALHSLASGRWHMLLSDISLPDGTGWDVIEETPAQLFAVSMSAHLRKGVKAKSLKSGFFLHIDKPLTPADLDGAVAACQAWWGEKRANGTSRS